MIDLGKVVPLGKQILELRQSSNEDQILGQVVELIAQTLNLYFVGVYIVDSQKEKAILKAGSGEGGRRMVARNHSDIIRNGYPQKESEQSRRFDAGTCVHSNEIQSVNWTMFGSTSVYKTSEGSALETKYMNVIEMFWSPKLPRTFRELFLPLAVNSDVIGVLEIDSSVDIDFTPDEVLVLNMLANYIVEIIN